MAKKIEVLVVKQGEDPRLVPSEAAVEAFERITGGPVEMGFMPSLRAVLFFNGAENSQGPEGGKTALHNVTGTYLLCGFRDNRYMSLSPSQEGVFRRWFAQMAGRAVPHGV